MKQVNCIVKFCLRTLFLSEKSLLFKDKIIYLFLTPFSSSVFVLTPCYTELLNIYKYSGLDLCQFDLFTDFILIQSLNAIVK